MAEAELIRNKQKKKTFQVEIKEADYSNSETSWIMQEKRNRFLPDKSRLNTFEEGS